jgi:hypothetical protein
VVDAEHMTVLPSPVRRLLPLLVAAVVLALGTAAAAHAAPVSGGAALAQSTGLTPSEVSAEDVCPPAPTGYAQCEAQVLHLRSTGGLVRPKVPVAEWGAEHADFRSAHALSAVAQSAPQADTPAFLQQAYDLTWLSATRGNGDTIAIVDAYDDPDSESDLATFRASNGLPACTTANGCFRQVNEQGQSSPLPAVNNAWDVEQSTDLDAVSALCPNCHILLVDASSTAWSDLASGIQTAAKLGANQISNSWSSIAAVPPTGQVTFTGISVIAATCDNGYLGTSGDAYPAAFAGVTAAGGTTLTPDSGTPTARGFAETAWSKAGSGCDLQVATPAYQHGTGCAGRAYSDVSADANPTTGLGVYDSSEGGWVLAGGTSLAAPLIAAYEAVTGVNGTSPAWAYADSSQLNDPQSGSNGNCAAGILDICNAGLGYDGPTGAGSISGQIASGAPGIGGPAIQSGSTNTYVQSVAASSAALLGGVYPNGAATTYYWQYGTTIAYGDTSTATGIAAGTAPAPVATTLSGLQPATTYHYRLVAQNSAGTSYGYDYTLTTPAASAAPRKNAAAAVARATHKRRKHHAKRRHAKRRHSKRHAKRATR